MVVIKFLVRRKDLCLKKSGERKTFSNNVVPNHVYRLRANKHNKSSKKLTLVVPGEALRFRTVSPVKFHEISPRYFRWNFSAISQRYFFEFCRVPRVTLMIWVENWIFFRLPHTEIIEIFFTTRNRSPKIFDDLWGQKSKKTSRQAQPRTVKKIDNDCIIDKRTTRYLSVLVSLATALKSAQIARRAVPRDTVKTRIWGGGTLQRRPRLLSKGGFRTVLRQILAEVSDPPRLIRPGGVRDQKSLPCKKKSPIPHFGYLSVWASSERKYDPQKLRPSESTTLGKYNHHRTSGA